MKGRYRILQTSLFACVINKIGGSRGGGGGPGEEGGGGGGGRCARFSR